MIVHEIPDLKVFATAVVQKVGSLLDDLTSTTPIVRAFNHFKDVADAPDGAPRRKHAIKQARHEISYAQGFYLSDDRRPQGVDSPKMVEIGAYNIMAAALNSVPEFALK